MPRRVLVLALVLVTLLLAGGCRTMKRTLTIDSVPSGATIWVNGQKQASPTPVTIDFTWYGWWEVRLEKEGYQSLSTEVHVKSRPDGYPLIDLPLERITPDYHVRRTLRLVPLDPDPQEADLQAVRERAEALRDRAGAPRVPGSTR
ncbi:MAG: PEGA domain-containing protein [Planctomycetota bacterium]